jgi:hypothetical protein
MAVALTRFKRTLSWTRVSVRELTHTLHLPPAHAVLYGGPHYEWLRGCLERLPRLQCLIVNGLPFFDHASLLTLRHPSVWWQQSHPSTYPVFGLRLLDASGCSNATSTGLAEALPHFPDLVSLDLSKTVAAKDKTVFDKFKYFRNLRVLKLRGLGLRDTDLAIIALDIGIRVRSLDVSDNQLTDASARVLLEHCLKETNRESRSTRNLLPPVKYGRPDGEIDDFSTEDLDGHLRNKLTKGFVGSLAIEEAREMGITHLYLSGNCMTVESISGLLRSGRLQVLDVGTLPVAYCDPRSSHSTSENHELALPGVEKLTPVLAIYAAQRLVHLRVHCAVVTKDCPMDNATSPRAELAGDAGKYAPRDAQELAAVEPPLGELDYSDAAVYELPGDNVQPTELPTPLISIEGSSVKTKESGTVKCSRAPTIELTTGQLEIDQGSAYTSSKPVFPADTPLAPLSPRIDTSGSLSPLSAVTPSPVGDSGDQRTTRSRQNSMHFVEDLRARLELRQSNQTRLHPSTLPKLHTLVLTDVPSHTNDPELPKRLIRFIRDCAAEVEIARIRATHTYMLPPGRSRNVAEREYAKSLFALRRIVLEVTPPQAARKKVTASWRAYPTKSSTEDTDVEAFREAAMHDFSFFDDDECGLPTSEPGRGPPLAAMGGLMLDESGKSTPPPLPEPREVDPVSQLMQDVIAEIGKFRRGKKATFEAVVQGGESEPEVEGYWPGDVVVVRKQGDDDDVRSLDYYGNRFESGWLYR